MMIDENTPRFDSLLVQFPFSWDKISTIINFCSVSLEIGCSGGLIACLCASVLKVATHEGDWLGDENTPLHLLTP